MSFTLTPEEIAARGSPPQPESGVLVESMDVESLLDLRARIDKCLPATALKDMNLEQELVIQFQTLKMLQTKTLEDADTPANQMAQVANSVGASLQSLGKMQGELYSAERFKQIEGILINLLNTWPPDMARKFLDEYAAIRI